MTQTVLHIPLAPDLALRDRYRRAAQRFARIGHPALAPLHDVVIVPEGLALTFEIPAGATAVADDLTGPEALALLAPVAAALAQAHDAGQSHGCVSRAHLRRLSDGSGLLVSWTPDGRPEDDVADFAELLADVLPEGSMGSDVVAVMISAADPDPAARPSMARIAAVLDLAARSHPPAMVSPPAVRRRQPVEEAMVVEDRPARRSMRQDRSSRPAGPGRHAARTHRRPPLRWLLASAGIAAIGVLGINAVSADDQTVGTCVVERASADADAGAVNSPPPPAKSPKRSSDRSR